MYHTLAFHSMPWARAAQEGEIYRRRELSSDVPLFFLADPSSRVERPAGERRHRDFREWLRTWARATGIVRGNASTCTQDSSAPALT